MDIFSGLALGFATLMDFWLILSIIGGIALGYFVGAMPGLSASAGMALLIPISFLMSPEAALCMLISVYAAAEYGSCITAITMNTPGTPGALAVVFDGYPYTQRGEPAKALAISIIASTVGGYFGAVALILFTKPIADFAIRLGAPEYALIGLLSLMLVAGLLSGSWVKGLLATAAGLLIATVGIDPLIGQTRFTFGVDYLVEGIPFVPILIGLCAVSEAFYLMGRSLERRIASRSMSGALPTWREIRSLWPTYLRGSFVGVFIGIIPGAGAAIASIMSYNLERKVSRTPEKFGTGIPEGVAAPEAANNSSVGGSLIPLLSLGIPGSNSAAVLIGAFLTHGLVPGPLLMMRHGDLVYTIFAAMLFGLILMFALGMLLIPIWTSVLRVPQGLIAPLILVIAFIGAYAYGNSFGNVIVTLIFGIIGLLMRQNGISYVPLILAVVLGELIEINVRRSLILSQGSLEIFVTRPMSLVLLLVLVTLVIVPLVLRRMRRSSGSTGPEVPERRR